MSMTTSGRSGSKVIFDLLALLAIVAVASAADVTVDCSALPVVNELYNLDDVVSSAGGGGGTTSIDYSADTLVLSNSPTSDSVCTLVRIVESSALDGKPLYQPVGRSYAGLDWERVAGRDAASVSYDCTANPGECTVSGLSLIHI